MTADRPFRPTITGDAQVDKIQREVQATLDRLEDFRAGLLAVPVLKLNGGEQLGDVSVVAYYGAAAAKATLPAAARRGEGISQQLTVLALGAGALTLTPTGNDKLLGTGGAYVANVAVGGLAVRVLVSDGAGTWAVR